MKFIINWLCSIFRKDVDLDEMNNTFAEGRKELDSLKPIRLAGE